MPKRSRYKGRAKGSIFSDVGFRSINTVATVTTFDANLLAFVVIIAGGKRALVCGFQRQAAIPLLSLACENTRVGHLTVARILDVLSATSLVSPSVRKPCAGASGSEETIDMLSSEYGNLIPQRQQTM